MGGRGGKSGGGAKVANSDVRAAAANAPVYPMADKQTVTNAEKMFETWRNSLNEEERWLIEYYQGDGYAEMNNPLRAGYEPDEFATQLQGMLLRGRTTQDMTVYRGRASSITPEQARQLIGKTYTDKGFSSTSLDFHTGYEFTGPHEPGEAHTVYQIQVPKGSRAGYIGGGYWGPEKELLLPHGAQFKVTGVKTLKYDGEKITLIQTQYLGPAKSK